VFRKRPLSLQVSHDRAKPLRGSKTPGVGLQGLVVLDKETGRNAEPDPRNIIHPPMKQLQHIDGR
jgi:hypothetical protein